MVRVNTLGVDLAKSSFTVCGLDVSGSQVLRKEFKREAFAIFLAGLEPCKIFMEACGSSHFWARRATTLGHDVKLLAPQKIMGFRKCNKNDKNDAHAICLAGLCPGIEFVSVKSVSQQDIQSIIRIRERLIHRQTSLVNEMRGLLAEYGLVVPEGMNFIRAKMSEISAAGENVIDEKSGISVLTSVIKSCIRSAHEELIDLTNRISAHEKMLHELTKNDERCARIQSIPGVGPITAATIVASIVNPKTYKNGRQFAASIGLTPRHVQTGGKDSKPIQLGISKHGNPVLRALLVQGGMTVAAACKSRQEKSHNAPTSLTTERKNTIEKQTNTIAAGLHPFHSSTKKKSAKKLLSLHREAWIQRLIKEKGMQKTAVAIANHNARIVLSLLKSGETYNLQNEAQTLLAP